MKKWTVPRNAPEKLLDFVWQKLDGVQSKRRVTRAIERGQCRVNGQPQLRKSCPLHAGQIVVVNDHFFSLPELPIQFEQDRVLFEDEQILAYNKPPETACEEKGLLAIIRTAHPQAALCHRLDADTSGALLLVKNRRYLEPFTNLFKERQIRKEYRALVDGIPKQPEGVIRNTLGRLAQKESYAQWGEVPPPKGRPAVTAWKVASTGRKAALVRCRPVTGRTHQIRVHLSGIGHPILGDYRYGSKWKSQVYPPRHQLHSEKLHFIHPLTEQTITILAPIPQDMRDVASEVGLRCQ